MLLHNTLCCAHKTNATYIPMFTLLGTLSQTLVITSDRVSWAKQGTVTLVDGEPEPPELEYYNAEEGWKMVRNFVTNTSGGDYQFPHDQILVVLRGRQNFKELPEPEDRELGNLSPTKTYLVWYHHLMSVKDWKLKRK